MKHKTTTSYIYGLLIVLFAFFSVQTSVAQETEIQPNVGSKTTYHNQLFFNRFLINPTFSLVRENKTYLNVLHRNQYATFEDNSQNYFLGFSNKLNENTALGISVYSQWAGVVQEFGFNANYARSVRLGANSRLTFGANVSYFNEGLNKNRVVVSDDDTTINEAQKESKIAVQPGITLSLGSFDFGLYAHDLLKYNQTSNEFVTNFSEKSIKASLQYTHMFNTTRGLFANARLMPLVQVNQKQDGNLGYLGAVLLELPKYGWLQSTVDDEYGISLGFGFNVSKKISLGYLVEKGIQKEAQDLGWNHEISMAYTMKNTKNNGIGFAEKSNDAKIDEIVRNYEEQILQLTAEKNKTDEDIAKTEATYNQNENTNDLAYQNRLILDELMLRQDSIEEARTRAFEKRFELIVRTLRNEIKTNTKGKARDVKRTTKGSLASNQQTKINRDNYKELPITVLNQTNIIGVKSGYYVIANVYKNKRYKDAFMKTLKSQGIDAKQFYNKENGLYYVYLADFNFKQDAETAFVSHLNGKYHDEKWIMQVDNSTATALNMYSE